MKNSKTVPMNIQLFGEPDGATTPTDNSTPIDYESEYKKILAERDSLRIDVEKQKKLKDQYAAENANYKKKEADKMTDEEKKSKELQELIDSKNKIQAELDAMKQEKGLLSNGFTAAEAGEIIESNFNIEVLGKILKTRLAEQEKSIRAELLKTSTPEIPLGSGNTDKELSYAEKLAKNQFEGSDKLQEIKKQYK